MFQVVLFLKLSQSSIVMPEKSKIFRRLSKIYDFRAFESKAFESRRTFHVRGIKNEVFESRRKSTIFGHSKAKLSKAFGHQNQRF